MSSWSLEFTDITCRWKNTFQTNIWVIEHLDYDRTIYWHLSGRARSHFFKLMSQYYCRRMQLVAPPTIPTNCWTENYCSLNLKSPTQRSFSRPFLDAVLKTRQGDSVSTFYLIFSINGARNWTHNLTILRWTTYHVATSLKQGCCCAQHVKVVLMGNAVWRRSPKYCHGCGQTRLS